MEGKETQALALEAAKQTFEERLDATLELRLLDRADGRVIFHQVGRQAAF